MITDHKRIVELAKAAHHSRVMVINKGDELHHRSRRHLRLYDDGPYDCYVRTGKRGTTRRRLIAAERICDDLYLFTLGAPFSCTEDF